MPPAVALPTRDRIVEAALRLFAERGTAATSMRDIAAAADVTVPGLYYHFDSKAALIRAVLSARGLEGMVGERSAAVPDDLPGDVESRIRERAEREFAAFVAHADFLQIMQQAAALGDPDAKEVGEQLRAAWRARWAEILAGARDLRRDADLDAAADCITTYLWGVFVDHLTRGAPSGPERIASFAALVAPGLRRARRARRAR